MQPLALDIVSRKTKFNESPLEFSHTYCSILRRRAPRMNLHRKELMSGVPEEISVEEETRLLCQVSCWSPLAQTQTFQLLERKKKQS